MSSILKVRIPFFRRKTNGGTDGLATFYLNEQPTYLPTINQNVLIVHTDVPVASGLKTKLNIISTNTVSALFQNTQQNASGVDGFTNFMILRYQDPSFSTSQFAGDCRGYIEYDVDPEIYSVLKEIETATVVSEAIPFDLNDGINTVTHKVTGSTYPTNFIRGMFVKRTDTNTIFANLLKSLNLPVSEDEMKKYTRSQYGTLVETNSTTPDTTIDGKKYQWTPFTSTGSTNNLSLVVHPTTGWTGEYYGTVLQTIGSYEYTPTNKGILPVQNELYLIFEIPNGAYGELIDGKSIKFDLPYYTGDTTGSSEILVDNKLGFYVYDEINPIQLSAYGTYNKKNLNSTTNLDRVLSEIDLSVKDIGIRPNLQTLQTLGYESNVTLLFSDQIKTPSGINFNTWSAGYSDLIDGTRVFNPNSQEKAVYDYNNDECIGFAALDKGFIVITHPKVVDSYFRNVFGGQITKSITNSLALANKNYDINGTPSTGTTRNFVKTEPAEMITTVDENSDVIWDSTQFVYDPTGGTINAGVQYISYNTEKSLNIICLASSDEFFKSTNDTAKELMNNEPQVDFATFKTEDQNLYPIMITQLGLHDEDGNLLAICKPTQPIKKYWYDVVSFNIRIRL
jgi:hypothetical protein